MDSEPIALEGGYKGSDLCIHTGNDGGEGNGQEGEGRHEYTNHLLFVLGFKNEVNKQ